MVLAQCKDGETHRRMLISVPLIFKKVSLCSQFLMVMEVWSPLIFLFYIYTYLGNEVAEFA
jgi:hypothetical protein